MLKSTFVVAAGVLYIVQALLGAVVVLLELPHTWVTAHLANAEILLAVLTVLAVEVRWPALAARGRGAPWTAVVYWKRAKGEIYEYACHEGNYSVRGMLSAARADERAAR